MFRAKDGGFRMYNGESNQPLPKDVINAQGLGQDADLEVAMIQKLHKQTKIFGLLVYKGELKGIRFYDFSKKQFIDIAPWQLQYFNISGIKVAGVRELELYKVDNEKHNQTLIIQYLTQHEIAEYYRPNRMTSNDLAKALSYTMESVNEAEYEAIISQYRSKKTDE